MTRDEARMWSVLLAALADGKQLQWHCSVGWTDDEPLSCSSDPSKWRVKPEPKLRPWTESEIEVECIKGTVLKSKPGHAFGTYIGTMSVSMKTVWIGNEKATNLNSEGANYLLRNFVIAATGAPCGVMEDA